MLHAGIYIQLFLLICFLCIIITFLSSMYYIVCCMCVTISGGGYEHNGLSAQLVFSPAYLGILGQLTSFQCRYFFDVGMPERVQKVLMWPQALPKLQSSIMPEFCLGRTLYLEHNYLSVITTEQINCMGMYVD